jgi:hypothetical protein
VRPQNIGTFAFHWVIDSGGHGYNQSTVFVIDPNLAVTPFVKRFRPAAEQHRHDTVVIRDGPVVDTSRPITRPARPRPRWRRPA